MKLRWTHVFSLPALMLAVSLTTTPTCRADFELLLDTQINGATPSGD